MVTKYKPGMIVFFFWNDRFYHKVIQYYNKKKFGEIGPVHVGIISKVKQNEVEIYEAVDKGFIKSDYEKWWLDERIKDGKVKIGECHTLLTNVEDNCKKYEGIRYGWTDILGIVLGYLINWRIIGITGHNALICSEAVVRILYDSSNKKIQIGYSKKEDKKKSEYPIKFDAITPMHLFKSKYIKII